jgi:hypothetical protein
MHYDVDRQKLWALADKPEEPAEIQRKVFGPDAEVCPQKETDKARVHEEVPILLLCFCRWSINKRWIL